MEHSKLAVDNDRLQKKKKKKMIDIFDDSCRMKPVTLKTCTHKLDFMFTLWLWYAINKCLKDLIRAEEFLKMEVIDSLMISASGKDQYLCSVSIN